MHELKLIQDELRRVRPSIDGKKVSKVVFMLGRLAHGTPDSIKQAFYVAAVDTPFASASLEVVSVEPQVRCSCCGNTMHIERDIELFCPMCSAQTNELIAGNECHIERIEVEE